MARGMIALFTLLSIFHQALSQVCPSGTPDGCRCQNRIFNCSGAGLDAIPSSVSRAGFDFDVIDLSGNNLVSVLTGAFQGLAVQTIILSRNRIAEISPGGFERLATLSRLDLRNNLLTALDQTGFNLVTALTEINLDGNQIVCNADIDWMTQWLSDVEGFTLTGACQSVTEAIADYLGNAQGPTNAYFSFEMPTYRASEEETMSVVVTRTGIVSTRIQFGFITADQTALAGVDYVAMDTTETMLEGQTRMSVDILLVDDDVIEEEETFTASITIMSRGEVNMGVIGTPGTTTCIITDNDAPQPSEPPVQSTPEQMLTTVPMPETEPTPKPTTEMMATKNQTDVAPQPVARTNTAAIVVPIVLIILLVAVIAGVYFYKQRQAAAAKGTTAGVRYAAVQNRGKVYGDVTAKA